ncbi:MAG: DUF11 domain-containing protein, partial [Verrucomicrobiota bacterium]
YINDTLLISGVDTSGVFYDSFNTVALGIEAQDVLVDNIQVTVPRRDVTSKICEGPHVAGALGGGANWINATLARLNTSDNIYAEYNHTQQDPLVLSAFGFNIPLDASILGIQVFVEGQGLGSTAAERAFRVGLTRNAGPIVGVEETGLEFSQGADSIFTLGSESNLWGASWTPAEINNSGFGLVLRDNDTGADALGFDYVLVMVCYRRPADIGVTMVSNLAGAPDNVDIVFSLTVSNAGPSVATGLEVTDLLPPGLGFVGATSPDYVAGSGVWTISNLAAFVSTSMTLTAVVEPGPDCQTMDNTAEVSAVNEPDLNPANNVHLISITRLPDAMPGGQAVAAGSRVDLSWTPACAGAVYDVLYVDADEFADGLSNQWTRLGTSVGGALSDTGQVSGVPPIQLGQGANKALRFYRLAYAGLWDGSNGDRVVSEEVYFTLPVTLYPGQNWIGLPGTPGDSSVAGVFGLDLPADALLPNATVISWLSATNKSAVAVTNQVFLQDHGASNAWMTSPLMGPVSVANNLLLDPTSAHMIELPAGVPPQTLLLAGTVRVTASTATVAGHGASSEKYVTLFGGVCQSVALHPSELNLGEAGPADNPSGFQGGDRPRLLGADAVDLMWKFDPVTQSIPNNEVIWFRTTDNSWRFLSAGFAPVPDNYFKPGEAFVIQRASRAGNGGYARTIPLQYSPPTRNLSP